MAMARGRSNPAEWVNQLAQTDGSEQDRIEEQMSSPRIRHGCSIHYQGMNSAIKHDIIQKLRKEIEGEILRFQGLTQKARQEARHSEMKQEGKYDTRGIEASYLADGQAKRLGDLQEEFQTLEHIPIQNSSTTLGVGSLVRLKTETHPPVFHWFFLTPKSSLNISLSEIEQPIQIISISSPLGKELLGLEEGDSLEVQTPNGTQSYEVLELR